MTEQTRKGPRLPVEAAMQREERKAMTEQTSGERAKDEHCNEIKPDTGGMFGGSCGLIAGHPGDHFDGRETWAASPRPAEPEPPKAEQGPTCAKCQDRSYLVMEGGYPIDCYHCAPKPQPKADTGTLIQQFIDELREEAMSHRLSAADAAIVTGIAGRLTRILVEAKA